MRWKETFDYWIGKVETVARIATPVVLVILGSQLERSYKEKEQQLRQLSLNQKYIEIAIGILNAKPTPETTQLRAWAIETVDRYSEIKLPKESKSLLEKKALPKAQYLTDENGNFITDEKGNRLTTR
jgi:hypothetical protein